MSKRLTEEMVIARTKISDLSKIKRLNCWGSELVDVSLLKRMPCVEVLSLSINKINSLQDFVLCKRLEELYIRQNDIRDLNQICYLQELTNLKNLWLGENPCVNIDGYRLAVIRALPQLQKLDNIAVTPDELKEAQRKGKLLNHPDDPDASEEDNEAEEEEQYVTQTPYNKYQDYPQESEYTPQSSPVHQEPEYETEDAEEYYSSRDERGEENPQSHSTQEETQQRRQEQTKRNYSPEQQYSDRRRESPPRQQYFDRSPSSTNANEEYNHAENYREIRLVSSHSTNSMKEYTNGERYSQSCRYNDPSDVSNYSVHETTQHRERHMCSASHRPPFNRRPVTRNSNILSAVLCLVKELDYPSLEVVEMAVRCRIDELNE